MSTFWKFFSVIVLGLSVYLKYFSDTEDICDLVEFVNNHGYFLDSHEVITEDGYILTLHRIPGNLYNMRNSGKRKPPIFLMHGVVCTSFDWVLLGNRSMALILAEAGYDVWMGNNRGNTYSRGHVTLNPDRDSEFWKYSYNEIGQYDLPAFIDAILNVTGEKQLTYLGYSEGFTSFLVMGSQRPEYNKKIKTMHAFAPVTDMYQVRSPALAILRRTVPFMKSISSFFQLTNEMMTNARFAPFVRTLTKIPFVGPSTVRYFIHVVGGSYKQLPLSSMKTIFINFPGGVSLRQIEHYVQGSITGHFRPYYNKTSAPEKDYDLSKVTAPIFLYYGRDDYLVNNRILLNQVAPKLNVQKIYQIPESTFNHVDFIWGNDISNLTSEALHNINENNKD